MSKSNAASTRSHLQPRRRGPRCADGGRRAALTALAVGASFCFSTHAGADSLTPDGAVLTALGRSLAWLEAYPSVLPASGQPQDGSLGEAGVDLLTWYAFASLHPEEGVRVHAGEVLDARLRALPMPRDRQHLNSLGWWSVLLRLIELRGFEAAPYRAVLAKADLTSILLSGNPTTRWWTAEFLRRSGMDVDTDFSQTFIAKGATASARDDQLTVRGAYRLFHELIPASDLGREKPLLTSGQRAFVNRVLPRLIELGRAAGNTDAVAEALVCAALMERRKTSTYRDALAWLLQRQRPDGTYETARNPTGRRATVERQRHAVEVASWALLTSLGSADEK